MDLFTSWSIEVEDDYGNVVYKNDDLEQAILRVWRDLMLASVVQSGSISTARQIVSYLHRKDLLKDMLKEFEDESGMR